MILYFIDDDHAAHVYHNIMVEDIESNDITVSNFYSVDDALSKLNESLNDNSLENWPDIIILDINMPIKTGWKFLEEYELLPIQEKTTRIFMATNSENPADLRKARECSLVEGYKIKYLDSSFFQQLAEEHFAL